MCLEHYYAINKLETVIENKKNEVDQLINLSIEINQEHKDCDCNAKLIHLKLDAMHLNGNYFLINLSRKY
ncbi:hypothetical protein BpHYR1_044577 [Brachionus plicatilis]|uniref:Uncharacterized protein n=1 Tax=Brachionus plicatilis TaxID=10195 RepID=A0A3M7R4T0_BRAPC|nr:hypothetical protein BpHYR1_044577 [Brachionus plicatilis]